MSASHGTKGQKRRADNLQLSSSAPYKSPFWLVWNLAALFLALFTFGLLHPSEMAYEHFISLFDILRCISALCTST